MSAAQGTKVFGVKLPVNSKVLLGVLAAVALGLVWYNFRGDDEPRAATVTRAPGARPPTASQALATRIARRDTGSQNGRGTLRVKPVDPTSGDIDPTLRLWLLARLQDVKPAEGMRNLFETGPAIGMAMPTIPKVAPMIPKPMPAQSMETATTPPPVVVNIPLRYYGFVKPGLRADGNRGFFMDGEKILVATEGDLLEQRYLVVALSPQTARLEDIQIKQGQDMPVTPEAITQ